MENNFSQIQFNIFISMLKEYVLEKEENLMRLENELEVIANSHASDMPHELMKYAKEVVNQIEIYFIETKDFFDDVKMEEGYHFFRKCFTIAQTTINYLVEVLKDRINRVIDYPRKGTCINKHKTVFVEATKTEDQTTTKKIPQIRQMLENREDLKKVTRIIGKDLENIDYYLNMLSTEDFQTFADTKYEFQKLMHHRHLIENIKPSQAIKEITETASLIESAAQNAEKIFHQSYLTNYLEFKTFLASTNESDSMVNSFKHELETLTKQKFIQAISKNADRIYNNQKDYIRLHQVNISTQTDDHKMKMNEKMHHLLMAEKRNNEKLISDISNLKKSQVAVSADKAEVQKKLEKQIQVRKQIENKYLLLQNLYNSKCYQLTKMNSQLSNNTVFKTQVPEKHHRSSVGSQIGSSYKSQQKSVTIQTDVDFYYYYENTHINDLHNKIQELEKIVNHKDYVIKEMQAVKTFRDNFKSKKQIFSAVMLPKRTLPQAKSLRYLKEQEDVSIGALKEDIMNSLEGPSTKKLVTFRETLHEDTEKEQNKGLLLKKKNKKSRKDAKYKTYFAFNDKVKNPNQLDEFISDKGSLEYLHEVSLKSILKIGCTNNQYKISSGTQTDLKPDQNLENNHVPPLDKVKEGVSSRDKNSPRQNIQKSHRIRQSFASTVKQSKGDPKEEREDLRTSNFMNQKMVLKKADSFKKSLPSVNRNSEALSPLVRKQQSKMMKTARFNQSRIKTMNNEPLHANKTLTLNLNFNLQDQSKSKPKFDKENRKVIQRHLETKILKMKK